MNKKTNQKLGSGANKQLAQQKVKKSPLMLVLSWCIICLAIIAVCLPLFGFVQELSGVRCAGFFGSQMSCVERWLLFDLGVLISPIFWILFGTLAFFAFIDQYNRSNN